MLNSCGDDLRILQSSPTTARGESLICTRTEHTLAISFWAACEGDAVRQASNHSTSHRQILDSLGVNMSLAELDRRMSGLLSDQCVV